MVDTALSFFAGPVRAAIQSEVAVAVEAVSERSLAAYSAFCAGVPAAPPQSAAWVANWGPRLAPDGLIAFVRAKGRTVMALPLEVDRAGPFRVARFMGDSHANGNFPPVDPAFARGIRAADVRAVAAAIAAARPDIDLVLLERLVPTLGGLPNPLLAAPHALSPNVALAIDLAGGFDAVLERGSGKRKRKKHRAQLRKFEAVGPYRRFQAATPEETRRMLDAFFAMKEARFRKMGIRNVFEGEVGSFFQALFAGALGGPRPAFVLHGLEVAGKLRAVTGASDCGDRLICEFGGIAEDELSPASPGDFLFFENIEDASQNGYAVYDFSVGDEPYKRQWCDIESRHHDVALPLNLRGRLLARLLTAQTRLKHLVKNTPALWRLVRALRRRAAGA